MTDLRLPVSVGEAVDKYSILEIKKSEVGDVERLKHIAREIAAIFPFVEHVIQRHLYHYQCLHYVNKKIWDLSDQIRDDSIPESDKTGLYAKTFQWNDARFRIKSKINTLFSSTLKEQKSYGVHPIVVDALSNLSDYTICSPQIRYLSLCYDRVHVRCNGPLREHVERLFQDDPHIVVGENAVEAPSIDFTKRSVLVPSSFPVLKQSPTPPVLHYVVGGKLGDFIHVLFVVMCKYRDIGAKGHVYITDDGKYGGDIFTTAAATVHAELCSIMEAQPYIESFSVLPPGEVRAFDVNLNDFRKNGILWHMGWMNFLPRIFRTSLLLDPWIHLPNISKNEDVILIHRSRVPPHRNPSFLPFLRTIATNNKCKFLTCSVNEYNDFPVKDLVPLEKVDTLEEMYTKINGCTFFIGNQSSPLAIAYSLGKPCLCESTQCKFYTDTHRPPNTFFWESEKSNFVDGMDKYVKRKPAGF